MYKGNNFSSSGILDTKVYFKPTDTHELLHKSSYHPKHTFIGIVKAQLIRYRRICTNHHDLQNATTLLFSSLINRGYNIKHLNRIRHVALNTSPQTHQTKPCLQSTCSICKYFLPVSKEINSNHKIHQLQTDGSCNSINCIYAIRCKTCSATYVGQTKNLRNRLHNHISDITHLRKDTLLVMHFNTHGLTQLHVLVLQRFRNNTTSQHQNSLENNWITTLRTLHPDGLNAHLNTTPQLLPCITPFNNNSAAINLAVRDFHTELCNDIPYLDISSRLLTSHTSRTNLTQILVRSNQQTSPIPQLIPNIAKNNPPYTTATTEMEPMQWITHRRNYLLNYVTLT